MENRQHIQAELVQEQPILAALSPLLPYQVPAGYFEMLPGRVLSKIGAGTALPLVGTAGFSIPEGYFEGLPASILAKIHAAKSVTDGVHGELSQVAPLLNTVSKEMVYQVPAGYFQQLHPEHTTEKKKPAKIVSITRKWMQYAAAAVFAGVLVTGAFLYTDNGQSDLKPYEKVDVPKELDKVEATDLVKYLDNPDQSAGNMVMDVKNTIHSVSDEELDQYLTEHSEEVAASAAN